VDPTLGLLAQLTVGEEVNDPDLFNLLGRGIEYLFYSVVPEQYPHWPPGSTTDGTVVMLCHRRDADTLVASGLTWIDFGYQKFPSRVELRRTAPGSVAVTGFIGLVDPHTGAPPRFPGSVFMTHGDGDGLELILGHRLVPITWTKAFSVP
jgi:hypothetical protein